MANFGPIQVPSNLSNLKTPADIVRFLSAFTAQVANQFNASLSQKTVAGVVGISGGVSFGGAGFNASLSILGLYSVHFRVPFVSGPAVTITTIGSGIAYATGTTTTGFSVNLLTAAGVPTAQNAPFSFVAVGGR